MRENLRYHLFSPIAFIQVLILSILILLVLVFTTPIGPALIGKVASNSLEALDIKGFSGTFLSQLQLQRLQWKDPVAGIEAEGIKLKKPRFDTKNNRFYTPLASVDRFIIRLAKSDNSPSEKITSLPNFSLPIDLRVDSLALKSLEIIRENQTLFEIKNLYLTQARTNKGKLTARSFNGEPIIIGSPLKVALNNIVLEMDQPHNMSARGTANYQHPQIGKLVSDVNISGTLTAYRFKANAALNNKIAGSHNLQVEGFGDYDKVNLSSINTTSVDGNISGKGEVKWTPEITWLFDGDVKQVKLAKYTPDWPAKFDASLNYQGAYKNNHVQGRLNLHSLLGQLKNKKITASGQLQHIDQQVDIKNILAQLGNNKVKANGKASPPFNLSWDINASELDQLLPDLSGKLIAKGTLTGSLDQPILNAKIDAKKIKYQQYSLGSANLVATTKQGIYSVKGTAKNLDLEKEKIQHIKIDAAGKIDKHHVKLDLVHKEGKAQLQAHGGWKNQQWKGVIEKLQLDTKQVSKWKLQKPVHITASKNSVKSSKFCLANHSASSCSNVNWSTARGVNIEGKLNRTPLALLNPWLPKALQLKGSANGRYKIRQVNGKSVGEVSIQLPASSVLYGKGKHKQVLDYKTITIKALINDKNITANTKLILKNKGELTANAKIKLSSTGGKPQINATGKLTRLPLYMAKPWLPKELQLKGIANGRYKVKLNGSKLMGDATLDLPPSSVVYGIGKTKQQLDYKFLKLNAAIDGRKITAKTRLLLKNNGELTADARIILAKKGNNHQINATGKLSRIPLLMAKPWLPKTLKLKGSANGSFTLKQYRDSRIGNLAIQLPDSSLIYIDADGVENKFNYHHASLSASINNKTIISNAKMQLDKRGVFSADAKIILGANSRAHRVNGTASFDIPSIRWMQPFIPHTSHLAGKVSSNIAFKGRLLSPKITGQVSLDHAAIKLPEVGTYLQNIKLSVRANDANRAIISGSLSSGKGQAKISGFLSLRDLNQLKGEMKIVGSNLQFVNTHEARGEMNPNISIKISPNIVSVLGKIHIPNAQITLNAIPESSISESEDVIVIGEKKADGKYSALKIRPNLTVSLGKNVKFKGFGLDTKLGGSIHVSHNRQDITTQGSVQIVEGKYEAYGQDLVVKNGRLVFNGPPSVIGMDIKAVRTIEEDGIIAGIHLTGTLLHPKTKLFSTPSLSESNVLSYLLTGRNLEDITGSQTALLMQAVRSLNIVNGDGLLRNIGNSLGLDDLSFVAKDDLKKSELRLGKKLGSRTYVRYIVGLFDSMQKIAIEYKVNKYLDLEAQAGADSQSIDLIYKIDTN